MARLVLKLHQPHKWSKVKHISDDEYYEFERRINNGLSTDSLYDLELSDADIKWLDNTLVEDEAYTFLNSPLDNYVITTYGRVINMKSRRIIKVTFTNKQVYLFLKGISMPLRTAFKDFGWIYVPSLIYSKYKEYNWRHFDS
tara:strand:+ start:357 stop:782 length:426 start_codon:yes stop_codon:yes gene_type:complete